MTNGYERGVNRPDLGGVSRLPLCGSEPLGGQIPGAGWEKYTFPRYFRPRRVSDLVYPHGIFKGTDEQIEKVIGDVTPLFDLATHAADCRVGRGMWRPQEILVDNRYIAYPTLTYRFDHSTDLNGTYRDHMVPEIALTMLDSTVQCIREPGEDIGHYPPQRNSYARLYFSRIGHVDSDWYPKAISDQGYEARAQGDKEGWHSAFQTFHLNLSYSGVSQTDPGKWDSWSVLLDDPSLYYGGHPDKSESIGLLGKTAKQILEGMKHDETSDPRGIV